MDLKNQLTRTPYLVLFIVLISIGVGTASALITITLAGDVVITGFLDMTGNKITDVGSPTANTDVATKGYVDSLPDDVGIGSPAGVTSYNALPCSTKNPIIKDVSFFIRDNPAIVELGFDPIIGNLPIFAEASADPYLGEIFLFGGNFAPRGFAFAEGQLLPIEQNPALFSIYGVTYGGDGKINFALPDLRCFESWDDKGQQMGPRHIVALQGVFPSRD